MLRDLLPALAIMSSTASLAAGNPRPLVDWSMSSRSRSPGFKRSLTAKLIASSLACVGRNVSEQADAANLAF